VKGENFMTKSLLAISNPSEETIFLVTT